MLWYCAVRYRGSRTAAGPALRSTQVAQLADSVYFLGFFWTLFALIDSFIFKGQTGAEGVFSVLGYALATTATGMFLRMFLLQFGYRADEQAGEAQLTVEEELQQFTRGMEAALRSLQKFEGVSSAASQVFRGLIDSAGGVKRTILELEPEYRTLGQRMLEQWNRRVEATVQPLLTLLKPSIEEFKASVTEATGAVAGGAAHLRQAITVGVQGVQQVTSSGTEAVDGVLQQGVAEVRASLAVLSSKIEEGANSIKSQLMLLAARIDQIRVPADIVAKTAGLSATVESVETTLAGLSTVLEGKEVRAALAGLTSDIYAGGDGVQRGLRDFAEHIGQLQLPEGLVAKVDEFNGAVVDLQAAIVVLGKVLASGSGRIDGGAKNVETTLSEFADDVKKIRLPKDTVMKTEELARQLRELEEAVSEIVGIIRQQTRRVSYSAIQVLRGGDL